MEKAKKVKLIFFSILIKKSIVINANKKLSIKTEKHSNQEMEYVFIPISLIIKRLAPNIVGIDKYIE